jgi:predicted DNA-binding ribbon-helix-helix protein
MQSAIIKRSIVIIGHKTSVSLEDEFWNALKEIARNQRRTLSDIVGGLDAQRRQRNLSSAIRLFVLDQFRGQTAALSADRVRVDATLPSNHPSRAQSP